MEYCTYTRRGESRLAIHVRWSEIEDILGRPHAGTDTDDHKVAAALLSGGAPSWVTGAEGWIDELGWGVYGPLEDA